MKTFKFSLVLRTRENTDVFITLDDNIYGIHSKRVNILYLLHGDVSETAGWVTNCIDPDQILPFYSIWSGSTLFAQA